MKNNGITLIVSLMIMALFTLPTTSFAEKDEHGHEHGAEEGHEDAHSDEVKISPEGMKLFNITIKSVEKRVLRETISTPARVTYNEEAMAHVSSSVAGRILELRAKLGDNVDKNAVLAIIGSSELGEAESNLLQSHSLLDGARSSLEVAKAAFERADELRKTNSISISDHMARQGEMKRAEAELKVADAAYTAARNKLRILGQSTEKIDQLLQTQTVSGLYELRAPIAGRVIQRETTIGEIVGPDKELAFVIADISTLWVIADVPERHVNRVATGARAVIRTSTSADAFVEGKVQYVAPDISARTRTGQVRIVLDATAPHSHAEEHDEAPHDHAHDDSSHEHDEKSEAKNPPVDEHGVDGVQSLLRAGMFAQVDLELSGNGAQKSVVAVEDDAIQTVEGRDAVFVPADEPDTYKPQHVVLGARIGDFVPVLSGLKEGDKYVASGTFVLKAEMAKEGVAHEH